MGRKRWQTWTWRLSVRTLTSERGVGVWTTGSKKKQQGETRQLPLFFVFFFLPRLKNVCDIPFIVACCWASPCDIVIPQKALMGLRRLSGSAITRRQGRCVVSSRGLVTARRLSVPGRRHPAQMCCLNVEKEERRVRTMESNQWGKIKRKIEKKVAFFNSFAVFFFVIMLGNISFVKYPPVSAHCESFFQSVMQPLRWSKAPPINGDQWRRVQPEGGWTRQWPSAHFNLLMCVCVCVRVEENKDTRRHASHRVPFNQNWHLSGWNLFFGPFLWPLPPVAWLACTDLFDFQLSV